MSKRHSDESANEQVMYGHQRPDMRDNVDPIIMLRPLFFMVVFRNCHGRAVSMLGDRGESVIIGLRMTLFGRFRR